VIRGLNCGVLFWTRGSRMALQPPHPWYLPPGSYSEPELVGGVSGIESSRWGTQEDRSVVNEAGQR